MPDQIVRKSFTFPLPRTGVRSRPATEGRFPTIIVTSSADFLLHGSAVDIGAVVPGNMVVVGRQNSGGVTAESMTFAVLTTFAVSLGCLGAAANELLFVRGIDQGPEGMNTQVALTVVTTAEATVTFEEVYQG